MTDPNANANATATENRLANERATDAALATVDAANAEQPMPLLPVPHEPTTVLPASTLNLRSTSLVVLAALASVYMLHWAAAVFVPLLLGLMFSYALTPAVNRMVRWHIPRLAASSLLVVGIVAGIGTMAYRLADDASAMIEGVPEVAQKLRRSLEGRRSDGAAATINKVQQAAAELERTAEAGATPAARTSRGVTKVQIERPRFDVKDYLWPGALGLAAGVGQATVVVFVTFFLLVSGDTFRRKMVKIAGPTFGQKKITLQALDEIDAQVQRYLGVLVITSAIVGVMTWLAFLWIGVERAAVWGVASFVLNFIPYLGSIAVTGLSAVVGFVQFGSVEMGLLVSGVSLLIHIVVGYILTPWLTSRASRMNPVAVFVGVLAWGWLWGVWGLFLGVPILMAIKAVCDRVDDLKGVGELLGH